MKERIAGLLLYLKQMHGAELYVLSALLVFGGMACFLLPVNGGYDEEEHLIRVWEMADLTFLPNEKLGNELPFPMIFREMSYRRDYIVRAVPSDFWEKYGSLSLDSMDYVYDANTRSVYAPPLLLPQALSMRLFGLNLQFPALTVFYIVRLTGVLSYVLLAWVAVKLIPYGKWMLAILATTPMAVLQAATVSPDTISNGIALLFIGGCLAVISRNEIGRGEFTALLMLVIVLFWGKVNIVPLISLPLVTLFPSRFRNKKGYLLFLFLVMAVFVIEVAGWNLFAYERYPDALSGADPAKQVNFILGSPLNFLGILFNNIWTSGLAYIRGWIALYGLDYWPVPTVVYYLYAIGLFSTLLLQKNENGLDGNIRRGLLITFVAAYVWTILTLYLSYTPAESDVILGVQGRYFIGIMPLLFLALACSLFLQKFRIPIYLPALLGGLALTGYLVGMYLSYHVNCGSQYYTGGLCYQPNYKNWAPDEVYSFPISSSLSLRQEVLAECDGMTEFMVWMDASEGDMTTRTTFSLSDALSGKMIVSTDVVTASLPEKNWYILSFPPVIDSSGRLYLLDIEADGDNGPRIAYSLRQEYLEGALYENSDDVPRDIIFKMGCAASWGK